MTRPVYFSTILASAVGFGAGLLYELFISRSKDNSPASISNLEVNSKVTSKLYPQHENYVHAINKARERLQKFKEQSGSPGVVIGVSVNGNIVWEEGVGLADVENGNPCIPETVMRIASISKPITIALLAKLWENGKVDFDKPIQSYVPYYPNKLVDNGEVQVTSRQLASHTAGIRHYKGEEGKSDSTRKEFYSKKKYNTVEQSVDVFKDDQLLFSPGSSFQYTTYGYTLLSAVIEGASGKMFPELMQHLFKQLDMKSTYLDEVNKIILNRASYYAKDKKGKLINAELADTSNKWAGGGLVSTVGDLLTFSNALLYSYQQGSADKPGFLRRGTVNKLWTAVEGTKMSWGRNAGYGLGWTVVPELKEFGGLNGQDFYVGHGGGAVGASSVLLIVPTHTTEAPAPRGVAVAVLVNMEDVSCHLFARDVAQLFIDEPKSNNTA